MKVHEAEMILEYCADIPCRLNIIRRQCAALDDEIDTMRGVNMDGMPRGGEPGDGPATMAVKMDELGIGDRFRVLHQQQEELRADFELIQKEIDSMSGVHNIILTEFYLKKKKWPDLQPMTGYSIPHMKRLRNVALSVLGGRIERLPEKDALLKRAYNARKAQRARMRGQKVTFSYKAKGTNGTSCAALPKISALWP